MKRREFITLLGGAAAWPLAAWAQQADRVRRIGVLNPSPAGRLRGSRNKLSEEVKGCSNDEWSPARQQFVTASPRRRGPRTRPTKKPEVMRPSSD